MTTRRTLFVAGPAFAATLAAGAPARAQSDDDAAQIADYLFVQTARTMAFDPADNRLTLHGVSPVTLFFADRPERIAGNMRTETFVPFWSTGKDSFLSDPPNADLSILEGDRLRQIVVVLHDPLLRGDALSYRVRVLQGDMPTRAADISVFIDIIGMPRTPVSYAGVARRGYRRAVYYR